MTCKCATKCSKKLLEEQLRLEGATEFAEYLIIQGSFCDEDAEAMRDMVEAFIEGY